MNLHAPGGHRGLESHLGVLPKMTAERHTGATGATGATMREFHFVQAESSALCGPIPGAGIYSYPATHTGTLT